MCTFGGCVCVYHLAHIGYIFLEETERTKWVRYADRSFRRLCPCYLASSSSSSTTTTTTMLITMRWVRGEARESRARLRLGTYEVSDLVAKGHACPRDIQRVPPRFHDVISSPTRSPRLSSSSSSRIGKQKGRAKIWTDIDDSRGTPPSPPPPMSLAARRSVIFDDVNHSVCKATRGKHIPNIYDRCVYIYISVKCMYDRYIYIYLSNNDDRYIYKMHISQPHM